MTREQTIEKLKALYTNAVAAMLRADACDDDESAKVMTEYAETLDSAITALQTDGDCISRQCALDDIETVDPSMLLDVNWVKNWVKTLPSVHPEEHTEERTETHACDCISRQAAIDAILEINTEHRVSWLDCAIDALDTLPSAQPDNSCDGCRYENADDGVLVPCGFCERNYPDNYERRTDEHNK